MLKCLWAGSNNLFHVGICCKFAVINSKNLTSVAIKSGIAAGNRCFYSPRQTFRSRAMSKVVKISVFTTLVKPVVYGSETWTMAAMDMKRRGMWEGNILRITFGPMVEQEMWRRRIDQEWGELFKHLDVAADIKKKSLEWIGHVVRMGQGRTVKKVFERKPEGNRRRGRPRLRWLESVVKDLQELKVKRCRQKAVDREVWVSIIKEAKAVRGPQIEGVSG